MKAQKTMSEKRGADHGHRPRPRSRSGVGGGRARRGAALGRSRPGSEVGAGRRVTEAVSLPRRRCSMAADNAAGSTVSPVVEAMPAATRSRSWLIFAGVAGVCWAQARAQRCSSPHRCACALSRERSASRYRLARAVSWAASTSFWWLARVCSRRFPGSPPGGSRGSDSRLSRAAQDGVLSSWEALNQTGSPAGSRWVGSANRYPSSARCSPRSPRTRPPPWRARFRTPRGPGQPPGRPRRGPVR